MNGVQGGHLQNVLSISTAANNRYLLHFNTLNSLTQWTAGIRLAMFEHTTLQEAYTGALIAGKGRNLNNIKQIMFPLKFAHEDWARVRFGAGTPWQRCWCVISPPDEKELDKARKAQKKSSYERVKMPKGDIKFYDTRKVTKKTKPIATVSEAYAAYAIYPQSKPLIEQSTLVKVEGVITLHDQQGPHEGFVFVMPEVHQMVSGFEIMLRWLFPTFDTFGLYGRPNKLIADTLDQRGLMFAMPAGRRYGYLDILDVSSLIHTRGSQNWTERQWRREMRKLTGEKMMNQPEGRPLESRQDSRRRNTENTRPGVRFGDGETARSTPGSRSASPVKQPVVVNEYPQPPESAPPGAMRKPWSPHKRAQSEAQGLRRYATDVQSRPSYEHDRSDATEDFTPPPGPPPQARGYDDPSFGRQFGSGSLERIQSGLEVPSPGYNTEIQQAPPSPHLAPPTPVSPPPALMHPANSRPLNEPYAPPELRRANSNVDAETLYEMRDAMRQQQDPTYEDGTWNGVVPQRQHNPVALNQYDNRALADRSEGAVNRFQYGQRLSTIPASPFVGSDTEQFQSPHQQSPLPQFDGVEEEHSTPLEKNEMESLEDHLAPPVPSHSTQSIARKPVPRPIPDHRPSLEDHLPVPEQRPALTRSLTDPTNSPLHVSDGWENVIINEVALERQLDAPLLDRTRTNTISTQSSEPDYASTASVSTKPKQSVERPRAGKLKTVGNAEIPSMNVDAFNGMNAGQETAPNTSSEIPDIDFGRTYDYTRMIGSHPQSTPTPAPAPSSQVDKRRSLSAERLMEFTRKSSLNDTNRLSYFDGGRTPTPGGRTPTPGGGVRTPEPFEERSTVPWPGASPSPPQVVHRSKTSVSPEEWVTQRAAMAQEAQYAPTKMSLADRLSGHNRSTSVQNTSGRRKLTKTPPLSRHLSGDWGQQSPTPRPSSRGAGVNLDSVGRSPSAMEQMQISKATGTPLVNLAQNARTFQEQSPGMLDIVAQRERDRAASREGRNSMFVQQAIERQQQQMRMEAEAQAQAQLQAQAEQQYQMQLQEQARQQQQMAWNQQMYMQNQQYANQMQQPPTYQPSNSFQGLYQSGYHAAPSSVYSTATDYTSQDQRPQQQGYGAGYMARQQQQYSRR